MTSSSTSTSSVTSIGSSSDSESPEQSGILANETNAGLLAVQGQPTSSLSETENKNDSSTGGIPFLETILNGAVDTKVSNISKCDLNEEEVADKENMEATLSAVGGIVIKQNVTDDVKANSSLNSNDRTIALKSQKHSETLTTEKCQEATHSIESVPTQQATPEYEVTAPVRPKTAKPPRRRLQRQPLLRHNSSSSSIEDSQHKISKRVHGKVENIITSSSGSTVSSLQDDNSERSDRNDSSQLVEQKAREVLLHRYLDQHLAEKLEEHKSYFERGYSKSKNRKKRLVQRRGSYVDSNGEKSSLAIAPYMENAVKEAEVKRTIRRLIAELAKYPDQELGFQISSDAMRARKPPRPQSSFPRGKMKTSLHTTSTASHISSGSLSSEETELENQVAMQPSHEKGRRKGEFSRKSILRSEVSPRGEEKHVRMTTKDREGGGEEEEEMNSAIRKRHKRREKSGNSASISSHTEFSYTYLAALLNSLRGSGYDKSNFGGYRVRLEPAPARSQSSRKRHLMVNSRTHQQERKLKQAEDEENFSRRPLSASVRTKSSKVLQFEDRKATSRPPRPVTAKSRSSGATIDKKRGGDVNNNVKESPRIRPGVEPIKCNWDPEKEKLNEKNWSSDHQLKNTDNLAILEWLRHKNAIARQQRIYNVQKNRRKRYKLMAEFNEKETHRENALIEYEKWKKRKNREILLRRRKEILDLNAAQCENNMIPERKQTASQITSAKPQDTTLTMLSDLRSSALMPPPVEGSMRQPHRRRPKSAPTKVSFGTPVATMGMTSRTDTSSANYVPVRVNFESGEITVATPSDRELPKADEVTNNFMSDLLKDEKKKSIFDIPPPGSFVKKPDAVEAKEHYDNWVRSNGTSSPYQVKYNKKKKKKKAKVLQPPHDPAQNDLISELAKRRIKKILDQKKRVDSGIPRKSEVKSDEKPPSGELLRKWRVCEDLDQTFQGGAKKENKQQQPLSDETRPVFTYKKRIKSKSRYHERNPVINEALNA